jgi:hypothetical protein
MAGHDLSCLAEAFIDRKHMELFALVRTVHVAYQLVAKVAKGSATAATLLYYILNLSPFLSVT